MPGAQGPAHGVQCIGQALLERRETLATVTGNLQQGQPEHPEADCQCHPPDRRDHPYQDACAPPQYQPKQQHPIGPVLVPGLLDHLGDGLHEGQLLEPSLHGRQACEVLLPQHRLHVRQLVDLLQFMQTATDALAHLAGLAEHRHHHALGQEEDGNKHHAEKDQNEFTGNLVHDCRSSIHSGLNIVSGSSIPRLAKTSRNDGIMPLGRYSPSTSPFSPMP
ncbi:hypothetical protein D3C84_753240 [compost metagenome]